MIAWPSRWLCLAPEGLIFVLPLASVALVVALLGWISAELRPELCRYLSVLDVHVNRAPYGGTVGSVSYTPGRFLAAYRREASVVNEANSITIENQGQTFVVKQIAGVLARRIVCRVQPGDILEKGQRYGLIRFGSRTDVMLPQETEVVVRVGDIVRGGESVLAFLKEPQSV